VASLVAYVSYLTTLPVVQTIHSWIIGRRMTENLKGYVRKHPSPYRLIFLDRLRKSTIKSVGIAGVSRRRSEPGTTRIEVWNVISTPVSSVSALNYVRFNTRVMNPGNIRQKTAWNPQPVRIMLWRTERFPQCQESNAGPPACSQSLW
jgi:hypothetical protein